jgi:hypothetical protein
MQSLCARVTFLLQCLRVPVLPQRISSKLEFNNVSASTRFGSRANIDELQRFDARSSSISVSFYITPAIQAPTTGKHIRVATIVAEVEYLKRQVVTRLPLHACVTSHSY